MNKILLLIYLADLSDKMCILLAVGGILLFSLVLFLFMFADIGIGNRTKKIVWHGIKLSIAIIILSFLYPSRNTLYIAASAKAGQIGIEKMHGSDTFDKALKLLDKKLDEALAEEKNGR